MHGACAETVVARACVAWVRCRAVGPSALSGLFGVRMEGRQGCVGSPALVPREPPRELRQPEGGTLQAPRFCTKFLHWELCCLWLLLF